MISVIVSDITETPDSIIPFGLNVGKYTETRVDIVHYFDPSHLQGVYSPFSDSQSITPGQKLSHEEILARETGITERKLKLLLSREASVLNYPLRVNTITETGDTHHCFSSLIETRDNPLFITGTKPGRSMAENLQELIIMLWKLDVMILIVPPGKRFKKPDTCCLVTDLKTEGNSKVENLFQWISPLTKRVYTSAVVKTGSNSSFEKEIEDWKIALQPYAEKVHLATPEIVYIDFPNIAFEHICERKSPEMIVLPKNKNSHFSQYLFENHNAKKLIEFMDVPLLLY